MKRSTLFFISFLIIAIYSHASTNSVRFSFEKFPYTDKLPSKSVTRICQDKEGYMWFGTKDGLSRFDGYDLKIFKSSAQTPGRLTNNDIQCITEDNENRLWVGTLEGINIIDKKSYTIKPFDNKYVNKERINTILTDSKGFVWIGTSNNGVLRINPKTSEFIRFSTDRNSQLVLKENNVTHIYEDREGRILISFWKGGFCFIDQSRKHIVFAPKIGNDNNPFRIYQDKDGLYWVCTWGDGIFNMKINANEKISLLPIRWSENSEKKIDDIVYSIVQDDNNGYIWVVTFSGLSLIKKESDGSNKILKTNSFFEGTTTKLFHEILKDHNGNLWIGSVGEGLYKLNFNKLDIQNFPLNEIKKLLNVPSFVTRFCELTNGEVCIAIDRVGLFLFNPKTSEIKRLLDPILKNLNSIKAIINVSSLNEIWIANEGEDIIHVFKNYNKRDLVHVNTISLNDFNAPRDNAITKFFKDSNGNVWIGSTNGLYIKPLNSKVVNISNKIRNINSIGEDSDKKIWIGTEKDGLFMSKPEINEKEIIYSFSKVNLNTGNYQSYCVQSICCTKNGDVYIGTKEGCLYLYDKKNRLANEISGKYGITDEGIMDIIEDNYGILWISTIKKIIKYNTESHAATYFSSNDGMLISSFTKDASIKLKSGQILYGGNEGISEFSPVQTISSLKPIKQRVVLSDILIQNKSIFDDEKQTHFNSEKNRVTLKYSENNLSIEFSALDFTSPGKTQFVYMLEGADNNWIYMGNNRRFVNYVNLPSGKYMFMIKATDENGLLSDQVTTLEIVILPPLFRTWWAYLIYMVFLGAAIFFIARTLTNRIRMRNELKISHIEKEKTEELAQIKLRYFTNISHELLTPLTIIMLLIESIQSKTNSNSNQFVMMKANVIRLKRLIQQILVFRKTESGNMKLKISENDIVSFVKNICHSNFQPLIDEKEIHFSIDIDEDNYQAYFDADKLDKILYNLLSNAFKHTSKGGSISIKISFITRDEEIVMRLSVSDTGEGIAEKDLPNIFKRFYISSSSDQSRSHGIGLALTSDLLLIHKGSIEVKSQLNVGSVFTIEIPISIGAYSELELLDEDTLQDRVSVKSDIITPEIIIENESENESEIESRKDYTILVVEDNLELKNLIAEYFSDKYHVLTAENGIEALKIIKKTEIDLVISDIMMPEMDGLTFCKMLKNDILTSHINVLMLTAKNSDEDRIDCYNAGADAFIAKPFELAVLIARTNNLINKRKQTTENFQKNHEINISSMEYGSIDEHFLNQAVKVVEQKLKDITFDFDQFAIDMITSKSSLHRKLKSLTGLSPGEFIRNVRLKHAAKMLINNSGNISEIAFSVGFNDPKYFSKCFKTEFGITPTEYMESNKPE
ncbi:MAG: two-component regulator propeller domain-containing protein [Candidatus Gastranaerophilales bacterium]|nr:two-component regulator propeller domain-containing protein [Candidatus Gastranaerophilales bacterium]